MKQTLRLCAFALSMLFSATLFAQNGTVSGTVTSAEDGTPLPGVNVVVKGTTQGAVTDIDGNYRISANSGDILVFSFIGMESKEVSVGSRSNINVQMTSDATQLSEVIVTGYGSQQKEAITGSVAVVDPKTLEMMPSASFQEALQGASPGLQVVANDGAPGAAISVRVRGIGSINASNEPLYVIDGIPVTSGSVSQTDFSNGGRSSNVLSSLNPNDIESLVVLKDAASTSIYGSRGANGVVLITTKSGKANQSARIDLKARVGFADFAFNNLLQPLNSTQYEQLYVEGYVNRGSLTEQEARDQFANQFPINPETGDYYDTNWLDEISRTGIAQEYDLSISGGSDKLTYFVSGSYFDQDGTVINNKFRRLSSRVNLAAQLTEKLRFTNNLNVSQFYQRGITDGTRWQAPFYLAYLMAPTVPVYDQQGRYYGDHASFFMGGNNPVGHLNEDRRELRQTRIIDNLTGSYEIIEGLTFKTAWSFDILRVDEYIFGNGRYGDGRNVNGFAEEARTNEINWLGTQSLTYGKTFGGEHNLDIGIFYEAQKIQRDAVVAEGEGFSHPDLRTLASAANPVNASSTRTEYAFNSYFAQANYDYAGKYFGSASVRRDGSSRFGPEKRWGTFWSVGAGYVISQEAFLQNASALDFLKLRLSYGTTGNAGIGNFDWAGLWGFSRAYDGSPGAAPSQVANPLLTWESQRNFNVGVDLEMFGSRLRGTVEYFDRLSSDLLLDRPLSLTTGFRSVSQNTGDMSNKGWEISLSGDIVQNDNFTLTAGANITFLKNRLERLPEAIVDGTKRREEGRDFQDYWLFGWAGVDQSNGDPLWYTDSTETEVTNDISEAERYYNGKSATPKAYGGFNLSAQWKGLSVGLMFNYSFGNYLYDAPGWVIHGDGRFTPRSTTTVGFENRWTQPGGNATFPQHRWGGNQSSNTRNSSRYLFEGDFIRLKTINIKYSFPSTLTSRLKMRSLQVYADFNNIWTWVKDDNLTFDPEQVISGVYNTVTPISKTMSFGINIGL